MNIHSHTIKKRKLGNPNMSSQSNTSYLRRNSWPMPRMPVFKF